MNASSGRNSSLSGTRMVEYTTAVHVPLYIWMDPYADFEGAGDLLGRQAPGRRLAAVQQRFSFF